MSRLAEICLAEGRLRADDRAWVALRLRQGRFSPHALSWLDYLCSPRASSSVPRAFEVRCRRAKRLGYKGSFENIIEVEKWFAEQGLHPF